MTMLELDGWPLPAPSTSTRLCLMLLHSIWQFGLLALIVVGAARRWPNQSSQHAYLTGVVAMLCGLFLLPVTYLAIDMNSFEEAPRRAFTAISSEAAALPIAESVSDQSTTADDQPLVAHRASEPSVTRAAEAGPWRSLTPWAVGLYMTGVAWMLLRLALSTWQAQRLRTRASFIDSGPLHAFLQSLARRWNLQVVPQLAFAEQVLIPQVVGLVRPTILLPAAAMTGLSRRELEMILAHELAHVRRYDVWIHLSQRLAEAVLFFNPALWFLSRRISLHREYCCDEMACQDSHNHPAIDASSEPQTRYAIALLRVVELAQLQTPTADLGSLAASGRSPSELRRRVARLLGEPLREPIRFTRGAALTVFGVCLLLASPVVWQARGQSPQPQVAEPDNPALAPELPSVPDASQPSNNTPATITGRIVLENGEPATTGGWMYYESKFEKGNSTHTTQGTDDRYTDQFSSKVPAGKIWLSYFPDDFAPTWAGPFELKAGQIQTDVNLVLKRGFSSLIQVRDDQGAAIAAATVNAQPEIHGHIHAPIINQATDDNGNLRLNHLAETRYTLRIQAPGYQPLRTEPLDVAPNKTLVLTMLRAPATTGLVLNADGTPAAKAKLRMVNELTQDGRGVGYAGSDPGFWGRVVTTANSQGEFKLEQLTPGSKYLFVIETQDGARAAVQDLVAGRQDVRITVPPRRDLIIRVKGDPSTLFQLPDKLRASVRQRIRSKHSNLLGGSAEIHIDEKGGTAVFRGLIADLNPDVSSQEISVQLRGAGSLKQTVEMDPQRDTLVEFEISEGDVEYTQTNINESDRYRLTRLARAAEQGQAATVKALLDAGADINQAADGYTALMRACIGKQPETTKILLEAGADPNLQRHDGQSALHFAAKNGSVECAKLLLRHDADTKAQTAYKNWTPRDWAQHYKHQAVVELLKE